MQSRLQKARKWIQEHKVVYVFPSKTKKQAHPNLFNLFHPRSEFSWDWDESADSKVVKLWHLKDELARSRFAPYGCFLSQQPCFIEIGEFHRLRGELEPTRLGGLERLVAETLEENSPLSTRMLKKDFKERGLLYNKNEWNRALKKLQRSLLISNHGDSQRENSAMPSAEWGWVDYFDFGKLS